MNLDLVCEQTSANDRLETKIERLRTALADLITASDGHPGSVAQRRTARKVLEST